MEIFTKLHRGRGEGEGRCGTKIKGMKTLSRLLFASPYAFWAAPLLSGASHSIACTQVFNMK